MSLLIRGERVVEELGLVEVLLELGATGALLDASNLLGKAKMNAVNIT